MNETKQAILNAIEKYSRIAESKGYSFPKIPIDFSLKGRCAGQAVSYRIMMKPIKMRFNLGIAERHLEEFCGRTVPHEMAHILQYMNHPNPKPHGREWRYFCKLLTGSVMDRCHNYDTEGLERSVRHYKYSCSCKVHELSITRHNKIVKGRMEYTCKNCGSDLNIVKNQAILAS